ncbi:unnamed protein product [Albugo candida]|uniref:Uncharacterized protein n=1 Tax=Albugo candida TaxID=65357 RepID=A0A024FW70_9STRA|nr:unnamed protein product [Albugo candida]|eukprot:CCI11157.1 unnamed protein product [Albugo candida]
MRSTFVSYDDSFEKLTSAMSNLLVDSSLKPCGGNVLMDRSKIIYLPSESIAFVIPDFQYLCEAFLCRRSFIKEEFCFASIYLLGPNRCQPATSYAIWFCWKI